jgi:branched-chain amino acid transport system substrate-binding protein
MPYPWNEIVPLARDYQKLVGNKSGYSYYGIEAYAMARVMVDAIKGRQGSHTREACIGTRSTNTNLGGFRSNSATMQHRGSRFVEMTVVGPGGKILK